MISLLLLNNFYPAISYLTSSKEKESGELLRTVRSLVMVREPVASEDIIFTMKQKETILIYDETERYSVKLSFQQDILFFDKVSVV